MENSFITIQELVEDYRQRIKDNTLQEWKKELTIGEVALYNLLKNYREGLSIEQICDTLPDFFPKNTNTARNICSRVYTAQKHINKTFETKEIIAVIGRRKNRVFKLLTDEEAEKYMKNLYSQAMRRLFEYSCVKKKRFNLQKEAQYGEQGNIFND